MHVSHVSFQSPVTVLGSEFHFFFYYKELTKECIIAKLRTQACVLSLGQYAWSKHKYRFL